MNIANTGTQRIGLKKAVNPKARPSDPKNDSAHAESTDEHPLSPAPEGTGQLVDKLA